MAGQSSKPGQRDSFSGLAGLMKAKKPYIPISLPHPRPRLDFASDGRQKPLGDASVCREITYGSVLSALATPFTTPESVKDFLEREENESTVRAPRTSGYCESSMQYLEELFEKIKKYDVNDVGTERHIRTPSPDAPQLIPELKSPIHFGPRDLPTPSDSYRPTPSPLLSDLVPVVRLTQHNYDSMCRDFDNLKKEKDELQEEVLKLNQQPGNAQIDEHEIGTQLGLLRFQNEANRTQKADMGRALNEKEVKLKIQQLEIDELSVKLKEAEAELRAIGGIVGERDYLRDALSSVHNEHTRALDEMTACKDQELEEVRNTLQELQRGFEKATPERDAAPRASVDTTDYTTCEQKHAETIRKRTRAYNEMRFKYLEEHNKVIKLEDEIEILTERLNQTNIDDLKQKLREKTSTCDRQRSQLKLTEQHLKVAQERIMKNANNGDILRGAAHLVTPNAKGKLPRNVVSCSECYANNLTCDTDAKCRSCNERNTVCARWRCSLKHKLGDCPLAPCKLPHDSQGWLILQQETRPQW
ncbi:hypothetical protein T440DRAFT_166832 [Plenodomus tracheiphilus IPT5]|uniref:Uncharacterized protein n=1 Tax=Plenodomus tracheiphilus IPT5 TaxID=1408161 RepID=A0A6A7B2B9_9PLEO|nr:hypothetical protein T440DRAFT_166832 [Plenodomus tracheiphilus IPT5]